MTDDILEELREWRNEGHVADHRGYCHYCYVRFPCLWAEALDDIGKAADEIERLREVLEEIDELPRAIIWRCSSQCWHTGHHDDQCKPIDELGDIIKRALKETS